MDEELRARLEAPITRPPGQLPRLGGTPEHEHGGAALISTREVVHNGHRIVITTSYSITVDGEPLRAHVEVDALGSVHYHGLPNYNFASAVDMVKTIIDSEPAAFAGHEHGPPAGYENGPPGGHEHDPPAGEHGGGH